LIAPVRAFEAVAGEEVVVRSLFGWTKPARWMLSNTVTRILVSSPTEETGTVDGIVKFGRAVGFNAGC